MYDQLKSQSEDDFNVKETDRESFKKDINDFTKA